MTPSVTQYIEGTEEEDAFIIAGFIPQFGWGATQVMAVLWCGPHDEGSHDYCL